MTSLAFVVPSALSSRLFLTTPSRRSPAASPRRSSPETCPAPRARRVALSAQASTASSYPLVSTADRLAALPWTRSIADDDTDLLYMPFVTHQLGAMSALPGLSCEPVPERFALQVAAKGPPARIESWLWSSAHFRRIRATYMDAGTRAQVFNSVWYPAHNSDAPILGIDFLSFGEKKVLCVLDFQPLKQDDQYLDRYCNHMDAVRAKYDSLCGRMTSRFYDETEFFSKQLLFGKFDTPEPVTRDLFPAFKEYIAAYIDMIINAACDDSQQARAAVAELHRHYDQYSAERDPAVGLFSTYWGKEWAEQYTYDFLFREAVFPAESGESAK